MIHSILVLPSLRQKKKKKRARQGCHLLLLGQVIAYKTIVACLRKRYGRICESFGTVASPIRSWCLQAENRVEGRALVPAYTTHAVSFRFFFLLFFYGREETKNGEGWCEHVVVSCYGITRQGCMCEICCLGREGEGRRERGRWEWGEKNEGRIR